MSNIVRALFWRFDNGTRLPFANKGDSSKQDVYMEKFAGLNQRNHTLIWIRILHFSRPKPSSAGNYTCVANLAGIFNNLTVEVSGERLGMVIMYIGGCMNSFHEVQPVCHTS